jgi:pentose-5-phosphate-3-epimerase
MALWAPGMARPNRARRPRDPRNERNRVKNVPTWGAALAAWRAERNLTFRLEVDGGVDLATGPLCAAAGADTFVAGTAFFAAPDRAAFAATAATWHN